MFNKAHYLIRLENDPDQHMAGNNQKYDVKKISRQVVMCQIDWLDVFIDLLTGSIALCKVFSSRFKAGELSFIFIFTWVKQADFEKVICLRYILSCASAMQAHIQGPRKCYGSTVQADNANTCEAQSSQLRACTCAWDRAGGRRAAQLQKEITHVCAACMN